MTEDLDEARYLANLNVTEPIKVQLQEIKDPLAEAMESQPEEKRQRFKEIGGGDEALGFAMYGIAALPESSLYIGGGNIKAADMKQNLNELMNGKIETLDTFKRQILEAEAEKFITGIRRLDMKTRAKVAKLIAAAPQKIGVYDDNKYVPGSKAKLKHDKTALELTGTSFEEQRRIKPDLKDEKVIKDTYKTIKEYEKRLLNTQSFFTRDSDAFKALIAFSYHDQNRKKALSAADMQRHVERFFKLTENYASQYTTQKQKEKNNRRKERLTVCDLTKRVKEFFESGKSPKEHERERAVN